MFDNKFLKKDPLVEAVKQAQADGAMRRQAVAHVNEQFGVYSRNAVIRENLAAYDAAVEEAYKCMKEGKPLADKDYDKDGKIESGKAEYQGSRIRAAKMAGKLEEGNRENKEKKKEHEEKTGMEHIKKMGGFPGQSLKRTARELNKEETDYSAQDRAPVTKSAPKEDPSLPKEYPGAASSAPTAQRLSNAKAAVTPIKEDEQLDELKQSTIRSYIDKAHARATAAKSAGFKKDWSEKKGKKAAGARAEFSKRTSGLGMAGKKLAEEEQIDEISKELAGKYIKHADYKRSESSFQSGKVYGKELATKRRTKQDVETARGHNRDSYKREKGINTAVNKLTGRAKVPANESMMESIISKLAAKHMKEDQSF